MSFRSIFDRYKDDTATEDEKALVEKEIEKVRLINEYLEEVDELHIAISNGMEEDSQLEIKEIKKDVRRKKTKLVLASVASVVIILLLFQYAVIPFINSIFYNPATKTYSRYTSDIAVELATYTELHFPSYYTSGAFSQNTGIGKYQVTVLQQNKFTGKTDYFYGNIQRDSITFDINFWQSPIINGFEYASYPFYPSSDEATNQTIEKIRDLPSFVQLSAYISFDKDLSMDEFTSIMRDFDSPDLYISWVGVRNSDRKTQRMPLIGFEPTGSGPIFDEINETYPYYEISEYTIDKQKLKAEVYEKHLMALLQFQLNHTGFLDLLDKGMEDYYKSVLDYVSINGVYTYGFIAHGNPENMLKLTELEAFSHIHVDDMRVRLP